MYKNIIWFWSFLVLGLAGCNSEKGPAKQENKEAGKVEQEEVALKNEPMQTILFFGNSLTAGYGLEPSQAFPALIQQKIDSLQLPYKVINAGLSGETTAGGRNRIDWLLRQKVDVFVLELGANDGLRGIPVKETSRNLQIIVDKVKAKYPEAKLVLLGMEIPPNMGGTYAEQFRVIFRQIATKNNMAFVPFLLEGVGGMRELNLPDGIHPTAAGHKILAKNVWEVLEDVLKS
ncbi:arylesterase [Adhaeribacter aquaticus]|uniref:arylesterase n=1 Tax=Adhaeribacter aquaticus TaxID=299567 RepID=UPI000403558B|nr:arylesterase [Adhaeribacter aquaticus]